MQDLILAIDLCEQSQYSAEGCAFSLGTLVSSHRQAGRQVKINIVMKINTLYIKNVSNLCLLDVFLCKRGMDFF